ncbi:hypothetical protein [Sphingomonas sp. Leaf208]|uniref:hypothetical protein n=1 Tax=Sphingomonas sp. Leaf208 TaxID=1735679 RepID=UPI000A93884F|nr:hypothetical protein [Sphingomonas sp. Leaf208]
MATHSLYQSYNPPAPVMGKPTVRIAFIAGDAAIAVDTALAKLPAEVPEATLDELSIGEWASSTIAEAKPVLSPGMYTAFLKWGRAAVAFETDRDDGLSDGLCAALMEALGNLSAVPAHGLQDILFKAWLLNLEISDSHSFGPLRFRPEDSSYALNRVATGLGSDLTVLSPLIAAIERLSRRASSYSPPGLGFPFARPVGAMIVGAFSAAAQRENVDVEQGTSWDAAMGAYIAADHLCNVMLPDDPQADEKVDACCEAMDYLIEKVRAPNLAALSLKLDFAAGRAECFEDVLFGDHARGIVADIRHLANAPTPADPHASWLADRNLALLKVNRATEAQLSEELASEQCSIATALEGDIAATPAGSASGVIAKLALIVQTALEGSSPDPDWCASALIDARRVVGIGSLNAAADARHREMAA